MENVIIVVVLLAVLGFAGGYVYRAKKSGKRCIGCPNESSCNKSICKGCSGCGNEKDNK